MRTGRGVLPTEVATQLLPRVARLPPGDASARPAVLRRLDELPAGCVARALMQVDEACDERAPHSAATVQAHWVRTPAQWLQQLRSADCPAGDGCLSGHVLRPAPQTTDGSVR